MSFFRLIVRSASYHWRTNLAVTLGVAAAVAVLAGALLVGDSVRGSLRELAVGRLGRTEMVVSSGDFFREDLAGEVAAAAPGSAAAPLVVATAFVTHEASGKRASGIHVYGVDERFWTFHGVEVPDGVTISPALAGELGPQSGDVLLVRLQKPSEVPIESLFGRKDDIGRTMRLTLGAVQPRDRLGEFALQPQQSEVRAIFAPLRRIQRDLAVPNRVNTLLVSGQDEEAFDARLKGVLQLEDLGARVSTAGEPPNVIVEGPGGILNETLESAARNAGAQLGLSAVPVFTYLANTIRKGDRQVPYSLITATDLGALPVSGGAVQDGDDSIVLNDWTARELAAVPGDRIDVDYYLWDPAAGLTTETASFTLSRIVPIAGLAADRRLAPDYPGITGAGSLADWDPPFPLELSRVRPQDEKYWDTYRTTAKAFIPYERGKALWQTRYGAATSIRFPIPATAPDDPPSPAAGQSEGPALEERMRQALHGSLQPASMGVRVSPARRLAIEASEGATDFGEYFTYFSFFLVVSALLLAILFFRLGVEQRLRQIGILRAAGFTISRVRQLLLVEALALAALGSALGVVGAIAYGKVIVYGLGTWWVGAVGTTLLTLHVSWPSLVAGALAGILAAAACVVLSLRSVARLSPRALLTAQTLDSGASADPRRARRNRIIGAGLAVAGLAMLAAGFFDRSLQGDLFFGAGAVLLTAAMFLLSAWLRARDVRPVSGRGLLPVSKLGFRSAAYRPSRSVMSAALIASAAFIIVSVDAFRRSGGEIVADRKSGTGGYVLMAESELPLLHNPNDPAGREALIVQAPEFSRARFTRFRVRPGEDASCLNLYRPTNPIIIAPETGFLEQGRFAFAGSLAETDAERENPWLLLKKASADGSVPVIADATALQYVLHLGVGDTFALDTGAAEPLTLRFVAALSDSVLQGQFVMSEEHFVKLFPSQQGYRFFLIDAPDVRTAEDAAALSGMLERELTTFGFDAVTAAERLEAFHRVENTYLSTFQALGGLGLLLGTIGLAAVMFRNVLERRRELALLRAVGYDARRLSTVIMAEAVLLLGAGLAAGAGSAALAVAPAWFGRTGSAPGAGLFVLLASVAIAGIISSLVATRAALGGNVLEGLRGE
jgi:ABC-type antimicrobial peptide transport system permease subunit